MSMRIRLKSSQLAKRRRKLRIIKVTAFLFLFLSLVVFTGWLMGFEEVTVQNITIIGNSTVTTESLRLLVNKNIEGKYMFVFPKSSIFIYPRKAVEASVLESFKRIKSTKVSFEDFQSISVTVDERKPEALWCGESISTPLKKGNCYFLDEEGFVFAKAPDFSGNAFLRFFGLLNSGNPIGEQFIPQDEFITLSLFAESLKEISMEPIALDLTETGEIIVYVKNGSRILFNRNQNFGTVLSNIESVIESEEFKGRVDEFEYLDVRFGNKVYYKFKE